MAELDLLRSLPADLVEPSEEARARARGRLLRHIRRSGQTHHRRRLLVPAVALAGAAAIAALVGVGRHGQTTAAAAPFLRQTGHVALRQPPPTPVTRGHYRYTKSLIAYLVIDGDKHWVALAPKVREIWLGPTGGQIRETSSGPVFLSAADRGRWIAAGRPPVTAPEATETLPPPLPLDLPTNPDALYKKLHDEAVGNANGTESEMLTEVGDALRETDASPALRAALYEVAARIPGIELVGPVTDRIGRHGIAVAYSSRPDDQRHELIFDPKTSALLGEEYRALSGNEFGYAPGTLIGYATYVRTGVADRLGVRP